MTSASSSLAGLPLEQLALYHAVDPLLQSSVFVFHGPVTTANSTVSSSRIQAHIVSVAGVQSYPRITVSPAAPLYAAVNHLPREKQADEVYRGLAVCLLKYFSELSDTVKDGLTIFSRSGKQGVKGSPRVMFDEVHAAEVANKLVRVEDQSVAMEVVRDLRDAFGDRIIPWIDIDIVLPAGTIATTRQDVPRDSAVYDVECPEKFSDRFGIYSPLIEMLGEPVFLPTSKLKRAPSQPTNLSKSKIFSAAQKESLRLAMCEVVDTEERYVGKMYDLVHNIAQQFRQKAIDRPSNSTSPSETELARLFPPCLNEILDVNMGFLNAIRQILDETEQVALADITKDTPLDSSAFPRDPITGKRQDSMGIIPFSQCLLEWFPRFSQPYAAYMHAHTSFSKILNNFLGDQNSSFSKRVQETGEQRMRSLLMEPVQRLPRYSLLIDAMTSALPLVHPAVRRLLKARDTITEICSLDSISPHNNRSQNLQRLQRLVAEWPSSTVPLGRLITAADFYTLPAPHRIGSAVSRTEPGIMLVYTDYLIFLSKSPDGKTTARGLYADLDKPQPVDTGNVTINPDLKLAHAIPISNVRATQSKCGRVLYFLPAENFLRNEHSQSKPPIHALELATTYEGKAGRLIEEITKARIEGRFPEHYRERGKWSLHNPGANLGDTKALVSVFESEVESMGIPTSSSIVKVVFDATRSNLSKESSTSGAEVLISISSVDPERYRLDLESVVGINSTDTFAPSDFLSVLSKRLSNILRPLYQPRNPVLTDFILLSNLNILRVISEQVLGPIKASRGFRPPSPTKLLSSIWGGGQSKESHQTVKPLPAAPVLTDVPSIPPSAVNSRQNYDFPSHSPEQTLSPAAPGINITDDTISQLKQVEETFMTYVLAIQSRRGNIVGRVLRSRDRADPAAINELYNVLLEDPGKIQAAAEVPVDVLIVSFETFMKKAWNETVGPLIPAHSLQVIQTKFDSMFPGDFEDFFRRFLAEMSPQTRRALTSLVKLLAELLDASGNDGDRGALTAVFSEILSQEGDPRQHISLIDRLVEDYERLFDDNSPAYTPLEGTIVHDLEATPTRPRSQTTTGSVNSNTSSFRRRFGFGLSRERSKTESEGKVSSIIRSLSKSKGSSAESDSHNSTLTLSKDSSLLRSKSTDVDTRLSHTMRPTSRDRSLIQSLFSSVEEFARPDSSHSNASSHTSGVERRNTSPKKKRRSSLSDLPPLSSVDVTPLFSTRELRRPLTPATSSSESRNNSRPGTASERSSTPRKLAPAIDFNHPSPSNTPPPALQSPTLCNTGSIQKEKAPLTSPRAVNRRLNAPSSLPYSSRKRGNSVSQIPPKSPGLMETVVLPNSSEPLVSRTNSVTPATSTSPAKSIKLRMQNPQKLRERVQNEKKALASAESTLHAELASIGHELSNSRVSPPKACPLSSGANVKIMGSQSASSSSSSTSTLLNRIRNLETKVATLTSTLTSRTATLEKDIEDSLMVSERRARRLDELYREASAENEALYERFNSELSRVTREIRNGAGEEVLREQLREALEEVARVKKENLRLRREICGLRAQQISGVENGDFTSTNGR
ncbi:hypothetical protein VTO42DRAFT_8924 [Malbranchea cinnamomea]